MILVELDKPVQESRDLAFPRELLTLLVLQRCLKVDLSCGGELMLHIGDPIPYRQRQLADETKGSWILGTRASAWRMLILDHPPALIESSDFPEWGTNMVSGPCSKTIAGQQSINGPEVERRASSLSGRPIIAVRLLALPLHQGGMGMALSVDFEGGSNLAIIPTQETDESDPLPDWELFTPFHTYLAAGPGLKWSYLPSDSAATANGTPALPEAIEKPQPS